MTDGQATWPKEKCNTMAKRKGQKDKQHNGQKKMTEGQATQWPKENDRSNTTSNTMAKRK